MNRKKTYFTSDWHLFHENSLVFDKRPFRDIPHMHKTLINNYNSTVRPEDVCYFLGDMGQQQTENLKTVIDQLNGTKVFIVGNHDKGYQAMYNCGFDLVQHGAMMVIAGEKVTMTHCPLRGVYREDCSKMKGKHPTDYENWHGELRKKHQMCSIEDFGQFHLHGHIHSPNGGKSKKILDKQYDIGVVANKYRPVSISTIESWIAKYGT